MSAWIYLAFILLVQLGGIVWWASGQSSKTKQLEKDTNKLFLEFDALTKLEVRLSVVESILGMQTEVLREIRDELKHNRGS